MAFLLLGDEPNVQPGDPLGFEALAKHLREAIWDSRAASPLCVGIDGGWGTGKTSLMRRIEEALSQHPTVTTVWFNAWAAQDASTFEGLIKTVLQRLDRNIVRRVARREHLVSGVQMASSVLLGWIGAGRLVDAVWKRASVDAQTRSELRDLLHGAMRRWRAQQSGVGNDRLLVIFVDDLERASPNQVFEIFEAMKLYMDAPGFVFVVGYDHSVISEAVLRERLYSRQTTAGAYVEKIVQVAYKLPPPDDKGAERLLQHYTDASGTSGLFADESIREMVIERNHRNPRRIKRFLSYFVLHYVADPDWARIGAERLVEVLLLDLYYPSFMALFWNRAGIDPVTEFLKYRDLRLHALRTATGPDLDAKLSDLERLAPDQFPALVTDLNFIGLVESISTSNGWSEVLRKLELRPAYLTDGLGPGDETTSKDRHVREELDVRSADQFTRQMHSGDGRAPRKAPPSSEASAAVRRDQALYEPGMIEVLWIDDQPSQNRLVVDALARQGWTIWTARNGEVAKQMVQARSIDLLVSMVERVGDPNGGFLDPHYLRTTTSFAGDGVFYTFHLSTERRRRAVELQSEITDNPVELLRILTAQLRSTP